MILATTMLLLGCGEKPPPKMCSSEAPPAEKKAPLVIGMCPTGGGRDTDAAVDAPASTSAADAADATP